MKDFNVSVSIIEPTGFKTNMVQKNKFVQSYKDTFESLPVSIQEEYGREYTEKGILINQLPYFHTINQSAMLSDCFKETFDEVFF